MTSARTIALFRNDIALTVKDTMIKANYIHATDEDSAIKVLAEVDHRLKIVWGISLDEWNAAQN
jgi:hypothetical protein